MPVNETELTKGQIRKLNALRKSIGDDLAEDAFSKWLKVQAKTKTPDKSDPVAEKIVKALSGLLKDPTFNLGNQGYVIRRAKGKGASGFIAQKIEKDSK